MKGRNDDPKHTHTSVRLTDDGVADAAAVLQRVRDRLWPDAPCHRALTYASYTRRTNPTLGAKARHRAIYTTRSDEGRVCGFSTLGCG